MVNKTSFVNLLKKIRRTIYFFVRYTIDWIRLRIEIGRRKEKGQIAPVVLCIANPGSVGGTELQVELVAEALKNRFGSCLVLISGLLEEGKANLFLKHLSSIGVQTLRLRSLGLIPYDQHPFLTKMSAFLLKKGAQTAQVCHFFNPSSTHLAAVIKKMGLSLYYMETGMPDLECPEWDILHKTIGHFSYVSSVSSAGLVRLERFYGYRGPSCITPSMFNRPKGNFLTRKPIEGVFDLVYFGRMAKNKGVDLLIEAFHQLLKELPYARLFLIGSGERTSTLKNLVQELHLSDQVHFSSWLQGEALFSRLIEMDLFCLPSFSEGVPCSILEAMSIGLPVIATTVGGIPEIIEHNLSGILVPPRDKESLRKALLDLANNPTRRLQLREQALLQWEKVGRTELIIDRLVTAYQESADLSSFFRGCGAPC